MEGLSRAHARNLFRRSWLRLAALEACLGGLAARTSQVFLMREHLGLETAEICKEFGLTSTPCWVLLYRARMALRECLGKTWFAAR